MQFIDLMLCGKGHPVFDLLCMYSHYVFLPSFYSDEKCAEQLGMSKAEAEALYEVFLQEYYMLEDNADFTNIRRYIEGVHSARLCLAYVVMPGVFSGEAPKTAKERAVSFSMEGIDEFEGHPYMAPPELMCRRHFFMKMTALFVPEISRIWA